MHDRKKLFGSANWVMMLGVIGALVAAQWKDEALPLVAFAVILALVLAKARLILLDFMGLRHVRPGLARALLAWPAVLAAAGFAKALLPVFW